MTIPSIWFKFGQGGCFGSHQNPWETPSQVNIEVIPLGFGDLQLVASTNLNLHSQMSDYDNFFCQLIRLEFL